MANDWLKEKLRYDKVFESFEKVFLFFGEYYKSHFISDVLLQLNDKKARKALGSFSPFSMEITLNDVRTQILQNHLHMKLHIL